MFYLSAFLMLHSLVYNVQSNGLYEGAQLWKSKMRTMADIALVRSLMNSNDLSLWLMTPDEALFLVHADHKLKVHRELSAQGLNHTVVVMDVQKRIDEQAIGVPLWSKQALRRGHRMDWKEYPTFEVIDEYLEYLPKQYPSVAKVETIGYSLENRTIKMVKVSNGNPSNRIVMLVSGLHAREWIAITSTLLILREIVTKFDDQLEEMQNLDWYVIPLANPDGYVWSYKIDRFWRKNRRLIPNTNCIGVDLNRNFDAGFHTSGITDYNKCGESYCGTGPFSEPEVIALRDAILKVKKRLAAMIDFHAFGQLIMFPWCSKPDATPHFNLHNSTCSGMRQEILGFQKKIYSCGPTYHLIYPATGAFLDWFYSLGISHSYAIEGRDRGANGFLMPKQFIIGSGQEMLIAVKHLAKVLRKNERETTVKAQRYRSTWF